MNFIAKSWKYIEKSSIVGCWKNAGLNSLGENFIIQNLFSEIFLLECKRIDEGVTVCASEMPVEIEELIDAHQIVYEPSAEEVVTLKKADINSAIHLIKKFSSSFGVRKEIERIESVFESVFDRTAVQTSIENYLKE